MSDPAGFVSPQVQAELERLAAEQGISPDEVLRRALALHEYIERYAGIVKASDPEAKP